MIYYLIQSGPLLNPLLSGHQVTELYYSKDYVISEVDEMIEDVENMEIRIGCWISLLERSSENGSITSLCKMLTC